MYQIKSQVYNLSIKITNLWNRFNIKLSVSQKKKKKLSIFVIFNSNKVEKKGNRW